MEERSDWDGDGIVPGGRVPPLSMLLLLLLDRFWRTVVITRLTGDVGGGVLFVMVPLHTPQGEPTFTKLDSHQHTVNDPTINLTTFSSKSFSGPDTVFIQRIYPRCWPQNWQGRLVTLQ